MKPNKDNGKSVLHVDGGMTAHTGVIVGQSDDGKTVYVKSDRLNAPKHTAWDFQVSKTLIPVMIKNAKTLL